jgi:hypothetical protein
MTDISNSSITGRPLRFGIMCSGMSFPAWQARCIEQLLTLKGVEPALLIIDDNQRVARPCGREQFGSWVERLYSGGCMNGRFSAVQASGQASAGEGPLVVHIMRWTVPLLPWDSLPQWGEF